MNQYPPPPDAGGFPPNPNDLEPFIPYATPVIPAQERPTSVTVLAIIGISLSVLAFFGSACGLLQPLIKTGPNPVADALTADHFLSRWTPVSTVLAMALALLEMLASIGCFLLQRWARMGLIAYSCLALVFGLVAAWVNYAYVVPAMQKAIGQMATGPGAPPPAFMQMMGGMTVGCGLLGLVYPVCVLFFFNRPHVKAAFARKALSNP
jgi:hypothetical protein